MTKKAALKWYVGKVACNDTKQVLEGLDVDWSKEDFTKEDVKDGLKVEREHTVTTEGDVETMAHIALDHLKEFPTYYPELDKMEEKLKKKAELKTKIAFTMQAAGEPPTPSTNNTTAVGDPSNVVKPPKWTQATKGKFFQKMDKSAPTTIPGLGNSQHESRKLAGVLSDPLVQSIGGGAVLGLGAGALHLALSKEKRVSAIKKSLLLTIYGLTGARMGLEVDTLRRIDSKDAFDPRMRKIISPLIPERMKIKP